MQSHPALSNMSAHDAMIGSNQVRRVFPAIFFSAQILPPPPFFFEPLDLIEARRVPMNLGADRVT